jgi:RNA polymerase sigma-70 factor (ECF subfamily)
LDAQGQIVRLRDQDRSRWNRQAIARGFELLERAAAGAAVTSYHLEAEIASHHAIASSYEATEWRAIVSAYDHLVRIDRSPVVALNRAVAVAELEGAAAGLAELDRRDDTPAMQRYFLYHATRGELLERAGNPAGAQAAYRRALALGMAEPARRLVELRLAGE